MTTFKLNRITSLVHLEQRDDPFDRVLWVGTIVLLGSLIFSTALLHLCAVALTTVWIAKMIVRKRWLGRRTVLDIPYLAFVLARMISIPLSVDPAVSVQAFRTEIFFYVLFFVFTGTIDMKRTEDVRLLLRLVLATAAVASIIGTGKYFLGMEARASSTTSGYYTLGLYLCVVLPLAIGGQEKILRRLTVWLPVALILMVGAVFTFDRLHWLGMVFAVLVVSLLWERLLLPFFVVGAVGVVALFPSVAERAMEAINFTSHSTGRDVLWCGALMIWDQHPVFGFGLRTFSLIFPLQGQLPDPGVGSWHNDYLQVYMESGIVGLLSLCWLIVAVYYQGYRTFRAGSLSREYRSLAGAILLSCAILFLVGGVLDTHVSILFRFELALLALLFTADQKSLQSNGTWQG
jgi:O-antigen ligase